MSKKKAVISELPAWNPAYREGSTMFKPTEVGGDMAFRCSVCGFMATGIYLDRGFESHEIMHLLQQLSAKISADKFNPVMF